MSKAGGAFGGLPAMLSRGVTWTAAASSADGSKLAAVVRTGRIYSSESTPITLRSTTTPGSAGFLDGAEGTAIELQYIGNNQFLPISYVGRFFAY